MGEETGVELPIRFDNKAHEAMVGFWWTSVRLKRVSRRFFREHGTSEARFNLLVALRNADSPLTQNELSCRLLVDKSNVTVLIDDLEGRGLIRRNRVAGDRRVYHVTLTDAGRERLAALDRDYSRIVEDIMSAFNLDEQEEMIRLTARMRRALGRWEK